MLGRARRYAGRHAVAFLALFVALGGTALALQGRHRVDHDDFRAGAVGNRALAAGAVGRRALHAGAVGTARLAPGAVTGRKLRAGAVRRTAVAPGAVTGAKIATGAVGTAQLDPADPGLIQGDATLLTQSATTPVLFLQHLPAPVPVADLPGFGRVELVDCVGPSPVFVVGLRVTAASATQPFSVVVQGSRKEAAGPSPQEPGTQAAAATLAPGESTDEVTLVGGKLSADLSATVDVTVSRGTGAETGGAHTTIALDEDPGRGTCRSTAQTIVQRPEGQG